MDSHDTTVRPPAGSPNVLIVRLDDVGFGASSAYGGPCRTPTAERLAAGGLRYVRFHTAGIPAATRAALLTGRTHLAAGTSADLERAAVRGFTPARPTTCAPLAEHLRVNGWATAMFGGSRETAAWDEGAGVAFDHWPTGSGFQHFYGLLGRAGGCHPLESLTDHAVRWLGRQRATAPDRPFFMYYEPGSPLAAADVPAGFAEANRGRFDAGWDVLRAETLDRQRALGLVPPDCALAPRPADIVAWTAIDSRLRAIIARQMESRAAFLECVDHQVGRVVDALADLSLLDDTLVFYLLGDSPAPADGWALAMDAPYPRSTPAASHWGGARLVGSIVHWPARIRAVGRLRRQFHHVIDVAPTILEAARLTTPRTLHGVPQAPMHGVSMLYSFDDARAANGRETHYPEIVRADLAARPAVAAHGRTQVLVPGMRRWRGGSVIDTKNRSHAVTAEIDVPAAGATGVIVAQGGGMGGWSLYVHGGALKYCYSLFGIRRFEVAAVEPLAPGTHEVRMSFAYDGGGLGKGASVALSVDDAVVARGRVERSHAMLFAMDETLDVGRDLGEPVTDDYSSRDNAFRGVVHWVRIDAAVAEMDQTLATSVRHRVELAHR